MEDKYLVGWSEDHNGHVIDGYYWVGNDNNLVNDYKKAKIFSKEEAKTVCDEWNMAEQNQFGNLDFDNAFIAPFENVKREMDNIEYYYATGEEVDDKPEFKVDDRLVWYNTKSQNESSNKYIKSFREAVKKLEEENAATKYYKDAPWHYRDDLSNQATSFVSKMGTLFDYIRKLHDDYGFEIKNEIPNSQSKRLYNTLDKMYNLIPGIKKDMGYDAGENEYGNKEFNPYF